MNSSVGKNEFGADQAAGDIQEPEIERPAPGDEITSSGTELFMDGKSKQSDENGDDIDEREPTIISQRPVAAPEEFFRSMPLAELAAMLEGKHLDHFKVEQMIGGGGMGAVFRGRDERLDRTVAIKVIPAAKRDPETLRRFRLEAQAAARLDHPNIARVYYIGEADQWNYIVFEFIDGVNIRDLVAMEGPLSVDDAVYYTRQIAEALYHAHERAVVHRDIKPSNILVTAGGIAKVVDMGLARNTALEKSTADATASGITLGTFDYISPEQARDPRDADVRSDLYSLGCSLFFMLTGHPPFPEGTALQKLLNHGSQPPPDPRGWRDDLSDQLFEIVMKLMAKQPGNRYQRPVDLINDLMLLAKAEDLPRSQLPGSMLITPAVAQRSLLETNLPWMVAFAFLLGSTLWLRSVQAISDDYMFPELPSAPALSGFVEPAAAGNTQASQAAAANSFGENIPSFETSTPDGARAPGSTSIDLLGSTATSGGLETSVEPALQFPAVEPSSVSRGTPGNNLLNPNDEPTRLSELAPIVVSEFRPADVALDRWKGTLPSAIQKLNGGDERLEIELRGRVLISTPLNLAGGELVIRGNPKTSPRIELAPELLEESDNWSGVFNLQNASVGLHGIEIQASPRRMIRQRKVAVFGLQGASNLILNGCSVTISAANESARSVFVALLDETSDAPVGAVTAAESSSTVTAVDTAFRGQASWLGLRIDQGVYNAVGIGVTNSLLALDGVAIDISRTLNSQKPVSRQVRLVSRQSTFLTRDGFAILDFTGPAAPLFSLNRTSEHCVFASSQSDAHIVLQGEISPLVLGDMPWLLLKGNNNAYDQNFSAIVAFQDRNGSVQNTLGFNEASQESWFDERGLERKIPWLNEPSPTANLAQRNIDDFRIRQIGFLTVGVQDSTDFPDLR